jgi:predicted lipase
MDPSYAMYAYSAARSIIAYKSHEIIKKLWLEAKQNINKSRLSYSIFENVESEPVFFSNDETSAQGFSYVQNRILYITFRGTQEKHDIIVDINILLDYMFPIRDRKILIHKGFLTQFQSLQIAIEEEIKKHKDSIDALYFSGHSLGAALATIASAYYGYEYRDTPIRIVCHTFGCPRVGNKHFINMFQTYVGQHTRIRNESDPVTIIPISWRFTHISNSITVNNKQEVRIVNETPWYLRIFYFPLELDYRAPIKHHSCVLYLERMIWCARFDTELDFKDLL